MYTRTIMYVRTYGRTYLLTHLGVPYAVLGWAWLHACLRPFLKLHGPDGTYPTTYCVLLFPCVAWRSSQSACRAALFTKLHAGDKSAETERRGLACFLLRSTSNRSGVTWIWSMIRV